MDFEPTERQVYWRNRVRDFIEAHVRPRVGDYKKEVGNHDQWLYVDSGSTYISCAYDVRTVAKTIKRTARDAADAVKRATQ